MSLNPISSQSLPVLFIYLFIALEKKDAVGQPVMRQVACFGSPPPRWLTKDFSACCVITARRASHASPGQKERPRAAAARRAAPRRASPRLALQQRTRTRTRTRARPRSLRESEATFLAGIEPGAKSSRLEPRTGSTTAAAVLAKTARAAPDIT